MMGVLEGVLMELKDCAPLLKDIIATDKEKVTFKHLDMAFFVGSMPRREGMEGKDLLKANVKIFKSQVSALGKYAKNSVKVIVVGNPANTSCPTVIKSAPSIPKESFCCFSHLDHNQAMAQIALKLGVTSKDIKNVILCRNHSYTQYPDINHAKGKYEGKEVGVYEALKDDRWLKGEFIMTVQQHGATLIMARKLSNEVSAVKAIGDHIRVLWLEPQWQYVCMGVMSDGKSYAVPEDLLYSFAVAIKNQSWEIVEGPD
ncbi:malate dehydrogenase, cytoplasmic-like [Orycteropus afer afer]|uniref:Malate dehydrogenase, cytoplasmic-like n=1 Tax=Orycteropus afer afer TaxID=1230840 RepID=A0AC54Z7J3_ORYAF|nr:malate dehydrogenase, cytoplasmic-like [Orycteropus afer afer]